MASIQQRVLLTFEGGKQQQPCLWQMSRKFPEVSFDIRQSSVTDDIGMMKVLFEGDADDVRDALAFIASLGVGVDVVEGAGG